MGSNQAMKGAPIKGLVKRKNTSPLKNIKRSLRIQLKYIFDIMATFTVLLPMISIMVFRSNPSFSGGSG